MHARRARILDTVALTSDVLWAFGLTLFAGLSTGVGSAIAFFARRTDYRFLGLAMGFSAGVMLYVSFQEILPKAEAAVARAYSADDAMWMTTLSFFVGIATIALIDLLVPAPKNPHEVRAPADLSQLKPGGDEPRLVDPGTSAHMLRTGVFTALAISIHNFPEGLVTFLTALEDVQLGISLAIAIALHNIPEGISVAVPIYYASGSRSRAFGYSMLSGLSEPLGAVVGYLVLLTFFDAEVTGLLFAGVAGVMVYISLDELLPAAHRYGREHDALIGVLAGMAVMALSLVLLA
jgi:zinc transporter, ZIP family